MSSAGHPFTSAPSYYPVPQPPPHLYSLGVAAPTAYPASYPPPAVSSSSPTASTSSSAARHRINMACTYCRTRKIRCSGEAPCHNCVRTKRCCVFEEVPDEVNRRTKQRKAQFKALKAAGFPTKTRACKEVETVTPSSRRNVPGPNWSTQAPMMAYATPPAAGPGFAHAFPSVLTPGPVWTPELDGFSSIDPNYESSGSPTSSSESAASPTPWSSPLATPTTLQAIGQNEPRVSLSIDHHSPAFEFDGMTTSPAHEESDAHSTFPPAFRPAEITAYDAFPSSTMKRPSISYPGSLPQPSSGNPGLGFYLPADYAPDMPADQRFLNATADGRLPPSGRILADDSWTTPFSTIRLNDGAPAQPCSF